MANAYSGALTRSAHYAYRPPVPGVNPEHLKPDPDPDPFSPVPEGVTAAPYDVWQPQDATPYTEMVDRPVSHWAHLQPPVPSSVPGETAGIATTVRMIANHSQVDYRPNTYVPYKHASQGRSIEYTPGRMPWQAGESVPDESAYLQMGQNAYDRTNGTTEVYSGDEPNVGRYRLGNRVEMFGLYEFWTLQGQDAELRAYTGLEPQFPVDKPRLEDSAPYTPNSRGTDTWTLDAFQVPSMFGLGSETALTDYEAGTTQSYWAGAADFDEGGRL